MMGLSQLSTKCKKCRYVLTCDHKKMEALAYLPLPDQTIKNTTPNIGIISDGRTTGRISMIPFFNENYMEVRINANKNEARL